MPYLAVAGILTWASRAIRHRRLDRETGYVVIWGAGLFCVFSFLPVSITPLALIAKQTNYMLIFIAPFCMLAGYFLARLSGIALVCALAVFAAGSLMLAALERQAVRVFTANSVPAVAFAQLHPEIPVYAMNNAYRAGNYAMIMQRPQVQSNPLRSMSQI